MATHTETLHCAVIGLGKTGWSCVRYLANQGASIAVYDDRVEPPYLAAVREQFPDVLVHLGTFPAALPDNIERVIVSPGVDPSIGMLEQAREAGVDVIGDVELFARIVDKPVVGITGSNGKSTVTALFGEMARDAGLRTAVGGNFGTPALDLLADDIDVYVLELSSFQLETTYSLRCEAAAVLNLSPDHMDRHGSTGAYAAIKARIFNGASVAIANADDPVVAGMAHEANETRFFSVDGHADARYRLLVDSHTQYLMRDQQKIVAASELHLTGSHNLSNALAAIALGDALNLDPAQMVESLRCFRGLPHRCEWVATTNDITWINDSKGTNVGAAQAALQGMPGTIVWLAGGMAKGGDFRPLRRVLAEKGRAAILFGQDAPLIEEAIVGSVPIFREKNIEDGVLRAAAVAQQGDTVLLSPACASFDQFENYQDRGQRFVDAVRGLGA